MLPSSIVGGLTSAIGRIWLGGAAPGWPAAAVADVLMFQLPWPITPMKNVAGCRTMSTLTPTAFWPATAPGTAVSPAPTGPRSGNAAPVRRPTYLAVQVQLRAAIAV